MKKEFVFVILFCSTVALPGLSFSRHFQVQERPVINYAAGQTITKEIVSAAWYDDQKHWQCNPHNNGPRGAKIEPESNDLRKLAGLSRPNSLSPKPNTEITKALVAAAWRAEQKNWNFCPYGTKHFDKGSAKPKGRLMCAITGLGE